MKTTLGKEAHNLQMNTGNETMRLPRWQCHARLWMIAALLLSDLAAFMLAGFLAIAARLCLGQGWQWGLYGQIITVGAVCLLGYALSRLYPGTGLGPVEELRRLTTITSAIVLSLAGLTFFARNPENYSRLTLGLTWVFALGLVPLGRWGLRWFAARWAWWGEPVVVIGDGPGTNRMVAILTRDRKIGLCPVAIFSDHGGDSDLQTYTFETLFNENHTAKKTVDSALVMLKETPAPVLEKVLRHRAGAFRRLILVPHLGAIGVQGVSVFHLDGGIGLEVSDNLLNGSTRVIKRTMDIVGALVGLIFLAPIFGLLGILIKLDSSGKVLYRQVRVGITGKPFGMFKFRTMVENADAVLEQYLASDPALGREWDEFQKLKHDPRCTKLGEFLRKYSIDELPQLLNVLKGEMSLVGPRPFFPEQQQMYGDALDYYVRVHPGITGLWQVSVRNESAFTERGDWDAYYVRSWSIWLDVYILIKTVWVVIRREGVS